MVAIGKICLLYRKCSFGFQMVSKSHRVWIEVYKTEHSGPLLHVRPKLYQKSIYNSMAYMAKMPEF